MLPMGAPKTIAQLMVGANACLSVFLFVAAAFYFLFAGEKLSPMSRRQLAVLNLGLFVTGIISWICFFPMPAICTGLAGVLGFVAAKSKS